MFLFMSILSTNKLTLMKKILVFADGTPEGGGSGFENLVNATKSGVLNAEIVGVVSNHAGGGVYKRAKKLGIPFIHFPKNGGAEDYQRIAEESGADFFALSGRLKKVIGLDSNTIFNSRTVFNIHPGTLPEFGGKGMYGHHVHEAVIEAFRQGKITHSAVTMHFVTEEYDRGPIFCSEEVEIFENDTADTLGQRVNELEHKIQPVFTNLVVNGMIYWDGIDPASLVINI